MVLLLTDINDLYDKVLLPIRKISLTAYECSRTIYMCHIYRIIDLIKHFVKTTHHGISIFENFFPSYTVKLNAGVFFAL